MKQRLGRADLVRILGALELFDPPPGPEPSAAGRVLRWLGLARDVSEAPETRAHRLVAQAAVAELLGFGFEPPVVGDRPEAPAVAAATAAPTRGPELSAEALRDPAAPVPLWRMTQLEVLEVPEGSPEPRDRPPVVPGGGGVVDAEAPRSAPAASWADLEPRLFPHLVRHVELSEPDVDDAVRRLAEGELLARVAGRTVRQWTDRLEVWIDHSPRLVPLAEDQARIVRQLGALVGSGALTQRIFTAEAWADCDERDQLPGGEPLRPGGTVLLLGDLGGFGTRAERRGWQRIGQRLARLQIRAVALVPEPAGGGTWQEIAWERRSARGGLREEGLRDLLRMMAMASVVQPGLMRAFRQLLPVERADLGTEIRALQSESIRAFDITGAVLTPQARTQLRDEFASSPDAGGLRDRLADRLLAWRRHLHPALRRTEALSWYVLEPDVRVPALEEDRDAALADAHQLREELLAGGSSAETWQVRRFAHAWLGAISERCAEVDEQLGRIYEAVRSSVIVEGESPTIRTSLLQRGGRMVFRLGGAGGAGGSPLGELDLGQQLWIGGFGDEGLHDRGRLVAEGWPLTSAPIADWGVERPAWATRFGQDAHGTFAVLEVSGVTHRMRWIAPGRYLRGSPEDEAGRYGDEGPRHEVVLTQGFWLGETAVTQGLWEAVMGANPSRFRSARRPVEQVSWEECREFCRELGERLPELGARLPTEGEWEYACRAGTATATYAGDLVLEGERNAPVLDDVAWYGGNSGVGYDLEEGVVSSGWREKRHEHRVAGTRTVGEKRPNAWGLYDMLGNVREWCEDATEFGSPYDVAARRQLDPLSTEGSERVVRGGSWGGLARGVRAAFRFAYEPGIRSVDLGFRLAGGRAPGGGAPRSRDGTPTGAPEARGPQRSAGRPGLVLRTRRHRAVLEPWHRTWGTAAGRDRFGLWVSFEVSGVSHRMRWIAPGRYLRGSPEDEAGRTEWEGPRHEVVLTMGFWLGETAVTQELWEAVMGANPSRFRSARRPVERVSWEECREFCRELGERLPELGARLPTEGEWEYACRAGTATATYAGDLVLEGERNAPVLDDVAWYGGNSGVGYDLEEGSVSSGWREKRHEHRVAGTRTVGEKRPNAWGLYDMLGNVWEWCEDATELNSYDARRQLDPLSTEGSLRVVRGGSWNDYAWSVRAAFRDAYEPGFRRVYVGFRLAGGRAPGGGAPRSRDGTPTGAPEAPGAAARRRGET